VTNEQIATVYSRVASIRQREGMGDDHHKVVEFIMALTGEPYYRIDEVCKEISMGNPMVVGLPEEDDQVDGEATETDNAADLRSQPDDPAYRLRSHHGDA
jgi:hypothetical protein